LQLAVSTYILSPFKHQLFKLPPVTFYFEAWVLLHGVNIYYSALTLILGHCRYQLFKIGFTFGYRYTCSFLDVPFFTAKVFWRGISLIFVSDRLTEKRNKLLDICWVSSCLRFKLACTYCTGEKCHAHLPNCSLVILHHGFLRYMFIIFTGLTRYVCCISQDSAVTGK